MFCKSWKLMIYSKYKVARQGILRIDKLKQTFPFVPIVQLSTVAMKISHLPMSSKYLRCKLYQCRGASKAPFIIFMELASAHCIQWPWRITKLRLCLSPYRTISQRSQAAQGFLADASNYIENLCSSLIYANVSIFRYLTYPIRNLVLLPGIWLNSLAKMSDEKFAESEAATYSVGNSVNPISNRFNTIIEQKSVWVYSFTY